MDTFIYKILLLWCLFIPTIFYLLEMLGTKIRVNLSYCEVEEYLLSLKKFSVVLKVTKFLLWTLADKTLDLEPSMSSINTISQEPSCQMHICRLSGQSATMALDEFIVKPH